MLGCNPSPSKLSSILKLDGRVSRNLRGYACVTPLDFAQACFLPFRGLGACIMEKKEMQIKKDAHGVLKKVFCDEISGGFGLGKKKKKKKKCDFFLFFLFV